MAIRAELGANRERGAGHGLLRITGLSFGPDPVDFSLRRNQGTAPFLGAGGIWQATEAWHPVTDAEEDGPETWIIPLGPALIDPLVGQASNVTYQLTVAVGATRQTTSLRVTRPLFGSGAAAGDPSPADPPRPDEAARHRREEDERRRLQEEEAARRQAEEDEHRRLAAAAADVAVEPAAIEPGTIRWPVIAAALVLLLIGASAGAWYGCLIPGFAAARCQTTPLPPPPAAPLSCTGLAAAACYRIGEQALQRQQLEPARQLLQQASGLGSIEASVAVGRMYDPDTWSPASSPVAQPNWETAVFWYEKAARQGNSAAQATAGRLLCKNAKSDFERGQGRAYLEQAASAGNEEARQILPNCK